MSLVNELEFIKELKHYLNESDVHTIITSFSKPTEGTNINRRTGRIMIGVPSQRYRKTLTEGSLVIYKSVILKFAKFKRFKLGKFAPITAEVAKQYNEEVLTNGSKKHQTILTNLRILNRNVFGPVLNQEIPMPRRDGLSSSSYFNNKPQLTHEEVARTLKYLWDRYHVNRDHVYKMILIYYSGLRHAEAQSLTFKDILAGWSKKKQRIIIIVRRGKNNKTRNVLLFKGAPTIFFEHYLIPYLNMKVLKYLQTNVKEEDILKKPIFSDSSYQSAQKEFKKALKNIVMKYSSSNDNDDDEDDDDDDKRDISKMLKGAGIHSIRADYSTRTLAHLYEASNKGFHIALKAVGSLLGHNSEKVTYRHYINLGYNFRNDRNNKFTEYISKMETFNKNRDDGEVINNDNNNNNHQILESLTTSCGDVANKLLKNNWKTHSNLKLLLPVYDNTNIFSINNYDDDDDENNEVNIDDDDIVNHFSII